MCPTLRLKFQCVSVAKAPYKDANGQDVFHAAFSVVTGGSEENKRFFVATPQGELKFGTFTDVTYFTEGQEYTVSISSDADHAHPAPPMTEEERKKYLDSLTPEARRAFLQQEADIERLHPKMTEEERKRHLASLSPADRKDFIAHEQHSEHPDSPEHSHVKDKTRR